MNSTTGEFWIGTSNFDYTLSTYDLNLPEYYKIDESERYWNVSIPAPGLTLDDIDIKVKNSSLIVDLSEGPFTSKNIYRWDFDYKIKPKMIKSELKNGILTISIDKPKDSYFEVEIN